RVLEHVVRDARGEVEVEEREGGEADEIEQDDRGPDRRHRRPRVPGRESAQPDEHEADGERADQQPEAPEEVPVEGPDLATELEARRPVAQVRELVALLAELRVGPDQSQREREEEQQPEVDGVALADASMEGEADVAMARVVRVEA